jgi:hypothetical protein
MTLDDVIQLDLSMLADSHAFKFPCYPQEIVDYLNDYFPPVDIAVC